MAGLLPFGFITALAPSTASVPPFFGIYAHGELQPAFINDGVLSFSVMGQDALSTAPTADGLLQTYNKVRQPKIINTRLTVAGGSISRSAFLGELYYREQYDPTCTYDLATNVAVFQNYALISHAWELDDDRNQNVVTLQLTFQEVLTPQDVSLLAITQGMSPETWFGQQSGRVLPIAASAATLAYATRSLGSQ